MAFAKKVFVTGGTGFLGRHLVSRLLEEGLQIKVLARQPELARSEVPWANEVEWVKGDVTYLPEQLISMIKGVEGIYHLAGLIGYKRSLYEKMYSVNVNGTINVTQAAMSAGVDFIIYTSSVAAIGASHEPVVLNEDAKFTLWGRDFGYFETKHLAEEKFKELTEKSSIESRILNPATIYGRFDWTKSSRKTQKKAALGKFPFYTSGGVNVVHVDDVVEALQRVLQSGKKNRRYILGGENLTIKELFRKIRRFAGINQVDIFLPNSLLNLVGFFSESWTKIWGGESSLSRAQLKISMMFHWFSHERAKSELGISFRSADEAIQESVQSFLEFGQKLYQK